MVGEIGILLRSRRLRDLGGVTQRGPSTLTLLAGVGRVEPAGAKGSMKVKWM
jgi:hypothetical protein